MRYSKLADVMKLREVAYSKECAAIQSDMDRLEVG